MRCGLDEVVAEEAGAAGHEEPSAREPVEFAARALSDRREVPVHHFIRAPRHLGPLGRAIAHCLSDAPIARVNG